MGLFDFLKKNKITEVQAGVPVQLTIEKTGDFVQDAEVIAGTIQDSADAGEYVNINRALYHFLAPGPAKEPFVFAPDVRTGNKFLKVICLILAVLFIFIFLISACISILSAAYRMICVIMAVIAAIIIIANVLLLRSFPKNEEFNRRYAKYYQILKTHPVKTLEELAQLTNIEMNTIQTDLEKAIRIQLIPQGHFGAGGALFIASDQLFGEYQNNPEVFERYYRDRATEGQWIREQTDEIEQVLSMGNSYRNVIRRSGEKIRNADVSEKIRQMEDLLGEVFLETETDPPQADKMGIFISYYLSTFEKLLEKQMEIEQNAGAVNNVIVTALDALNQAYGTLFHGFCRDREMAFSMEVLMQTMTEYKENNND